MPKQSTLVVVALSDIYIWHKNSTGGFMPVIQFESDRKYEFFKNDTSTLQDFNITELSPVSKFDVDCFKKEL